MTEPEFFEFVYKDSDELIKGKESWKKVKRVGKEDILNSYPQPCIEHLHDSLPDNLEGYVIKGDKVVSDFKTFKISFMKELRSIRNKKLRNLDHEFIMLLSQDLDLSEIKDKQLKLRDITKDTRLSSKSKLKFKEVLNDLKNI